MIQQVTRGIKITVKTQYEGTFLKDFALNYAFTYDIEIENQSKSSVQLLSRHWKIFESLGKTKVVDGAGVVGKKPVLNPGEIHKYKSGCLITSAIGSMNILRDIDVYMSNTGKFPLRFWKNMKPSIKLQLTEMRIWLKNC